MKSGSPAVVVRAGDARVKTITFKCACVVAGVLIAGSVEAQCGVQGGTCDEDSRWGNEATVSPPPIEDSKRPLTLGGILDEGAKEMSPAEIRAAVSAGRLSRFPAPGLDRVTYKSDGTMTGHSYVANFLVYGEWRFDERGRQCFYWAGSGHGSDHFGNYCLAWFKLGDSIYVIEPTEDENRGQPVTELPSN